METPLDLVYEAIDKLTLLAQKMSDMIIEHEHRFKVIEQRSVTLPAMEFEPNKSSTSTINNSPIKTE